MTKLEYLGQLEHYLQKVMPQKEVNDIVRDYAEYFEEGKQQNKNDDEIAAKLGNPEVVAEQILEENGYDMARIRKNLKQKIKEKAKEIDSFSIGKAVKYCLGFLLALFMLPIVLAVLFTGAMLIFAAIMVVFAFLMTGMAIAVAALCFFIVSGFFWGGGAWAAAVLTIVLGIGGVALAVCLCSLSFMALGGLWNCLARNFRQGRNLLFETSKPHQEEEKINEQA